MRPGDRCGAPIPHPDRLTRIDPTSYRRCDRNVRMLRRSQSLAKLRPALLASLAGLLSASAWLDERLFAAIWIGMTLWIAVTAGRPPHVAFRLWLLGGIVATAMWYYWLPGVAAHRLEVSLFAGTLAATLAAVWDAFRFGVFGFVMAWLNLRRGWGLLAWPVVWVALEWVWPHVFPWRLGQSQLGWLAVCQIAEVTGVYGISFLIVWGAATAAGAVSALSSADSPRERNRSLALCATYAVILVGCVGWGHWRMADVERRAGESAALRIALVQPGSRDDLLPTLRRLTRDLPRDADLVVWGEATIGGFSLALRSFADPEDVRAHSRFPEDDSRPCPGLGTPLLCGGGSFASGANQSGPFRNTAYLVDADEAILGRYHKRILMPWGEYAVGQQWLPGLRELLTTADPVIPGVTADPLVLPGRARLGVLICYEDLLPGPARDSVLQAADVLVNLNNLEAFGDTPALRQHQQLAAFRAIENRRWLVRCGTTGSSAVISATGRVVRQLPLLTPATAIADVPLLHGVTIASRYGDGFAAACVVVGCAVIAARLVRRRRR